MKTYASLLLYGTATVSAFTLSPSDIEVLLPKTSPAGESDYWECATHDYEELLDAPQPTGNLYDALDPYIVKVFRETCTATGMAKLDCAPVGYPELCGFTTAASADILPAYSSYGSSASSWWAGHSSAALSIASECPHYWYEAMRDTFLSGPRLNLTIAHAQCYDEAGITTVDPSTTGPTATSGPGVTDETPKETGEVDSGVGQTMTVELLLVAASGLAAATMNAL